MRRVIGAMKRALDAGLHRRVAHEPETCQHETGKNRHRRPGVARRENRGGDEGDGEDEMQNPGPPESGVGEDGADRPRIERRAGILGHRRGLAARARGRRSRARSGLPRSRGAGSSAPASAAIRRAHKAADRRSTRKPASPPGNGESGRTRGRSPFGVAGATSSCPSCRRPSSASGFPRRRPRPGNRPPPVRHARS